MPTAPDMPPPECDRRGPRALLFFVVSLAVVLVTRTAGAATTVRDGDDYSIDLPDLCFVTPIALRTPGACAGLELPEHAPPSPGPEVRTVASGSFGRRPHTATNVGVLYLAKVHLDAPDEDALASLRKDALSIVQHLTTLPPGAHVRDPVGVTIVETPAGPAVRLLIDVDGILSDAPNNAVFLQHQVHYLLPTEEGTYLTSWSMPADSAAFYTPVADASIATAHVARPRSEGAQCGPAPSAGRVPARRAASPTPGGRADGCCTSSRTGRAAGQAAAGWAAGRAAP